MSLEDLSTDQCSAPRGEVVRREESKTFSSGFDVPLRSD